MGATQKIERMIVERVIDDLLKAGFPITVNDGEDDVVTDCEDRAEILAAMFSTDEDHIFPGHGNGWIHFIYGNKGHDVIHDYSTNLEKHLVGANQLAEEWS